MQTLTPIPSINPFAMLSDPQAVENALQCAARWNLRSRVCHPLDRPSRARLQKDLAAFDAAIDRDEDLL